MKDRIGPKIGAVRRQATTLSSENMVSYTFLNENQLPLVIQPLGVELNLPVWVEGNRESLRKKLHQYGAILFRDFKVGNIETFQAAVIALTGNLLDYTERSSPRHAVEKKVYTSTDYPPEYPIFLHNEQSYNVTWCGKICFFCKQNATESGGQTPIADTRKILARLKPEIVEKFAEKNYRYTRNYHEGFGLPWQDVFGTEDRAVVEEYCRTHAIEFEWRSGGRLRTHQVRQTLHTHPDTKEQAWFNHCTFFHVSTLPEAIRRNFLEEFQEDDLPNNTFYGDGTPLEPETIKHLQQAYLDEKVVFDWKDGDVLILDNMLTSHGREPFKGDRSILVAMSEPTNNN